MCGLVPLGRRAGEPLRHSLHEQQRPGRLFVTAVLPPSTVTPAGQKLVPDRGGGQLARHGARDCADAYWYVHRGCRLTREYLTEGESPRRESGFYTSRL